MGPPHVHTLVIPSRLTQAAQVVAAVMVHVRAQGYDEQTAFAIHLSLDEALANAIHHGNHNNPHKRVWVRFAVSAHQVRLTIRDEGGGFCPSAVPDPTLTENLTRPCGRGVMLMKAYMSQVTFNARGNAVTLIKCRDCRMPH